MTNKSHRKLFNFSLSKEESYLTFQKSFTFFVENILVSPFLGNSLVSNWKAVRKQKRSNGYFRLFVSYYPKKKKRET